MALFKFENISKSFTNRILFKNISYSFPSKGIVMLLGKSGSGKTTLFNILSGLEKCDEGKVFFKDVELVSEKDFAIFRKQVSFVFQEYGVLNYLTGYDNLFLGGYSGFDFKNQQIIDIKNLRKKAGVLSGGEKQRLAILKAICKKSSIIFCDEPTGALDENTSKVVMDILKKESKNKLIIMVTHNLDLAKKYGDEILKLQDERLIQIKKSSFISVSNDSKKGAVSNIIKGSIVACKCFFQEKMKLFISFLSLSLSLVTLFCAGSLKETSYDSIRENIVTYADYNRLKVSEITDKKIEDTKFSLSKSSCPSRFELNNLVGDYADINFSFDSFFSSAKIVCNKMDLQVNLIIFPFNTTSKNLAINREMYEIIKDTDLEISIFVNKSIVTTYKNNVVEDFVNFALISKVEKIFEEFSFLNSPCIFLSHSYLVNSFKSLKLNRLSKLIGSNFVSLYDRYTSFINSEDELSSYSMYVDVKNKNNVDKVIFLLESYRNNSSYYEVHSRAKVTFDTLSSSLNMIEMLMNIFGFISFLVSLILLYLFINLTYENRKKEFALYKSYGFEFIDYYFYNFIPILICTIFSLLLSVIIFSYIKDILGLSLIDFFGFNIFTKDAFLHNNLFLISNALVIFCILFTTYPAFKAYKIRISEVIKSE